MAKGKKGKERLPGFNGKCKACGQCCRVFHLPFTEDELNRAKAIYFSTGVAVFPGDETGTKVMVADQAAWIFRHVHKNKGPGYRCDLVTNGNRCPLHGTAYKPSTCKGYGETYRADPKAGCGHWEGYEAERLEAVNAQRKEGKCEEGYYTEADCRPGEQASGAVRL